MSNSDLKYELRTEGPDEFMVSRTYNFVSKWGVLIFLVVLTAVITACCFIKIPVTYTSEIYLACSPHGQRLYGKVTIPKHIAYSAQTNTPVNISFVRINDKRKFNLGGQVDSIYFDKGQHAYWLSISVAVDQEAGLRESGICTQPAQAVFVISERSILSSILL